MHGGWPATFGTAAIRRQKCRERATQFFALANVNNALTLEFVAVVENGLAASFFASGQRRRCNSPYAWAE